MEYFWETVGSIEEGVGFSHFSLTHIVWLGIFVVAATTLSLIYRKASQTARKKMRFIVAGLIVIDELVKMVFLLAAGLWTVGYLPFHLCTINIFLIVAHVFKPKEWLGNFLYLVCIPAAIAALMFPTWTELPAANIMHIHSFSIHILLAAYPLMQVVGGDIRPRAKNIWKCLCLLAGMAIPVYVINLLLDTNYFFLMEAENIGPLIFFEETFGTHLLAFPVIIAVLVAAMYLPWNLASRKTNKR